MRRLVLVANEDLFFGRKRTKIKKYLGHILKFEYKIWNSIFYFADTPSLLDHVSVCSASERETKKIN